MVERLDDDGVADAGTLLRRAAAAHPDREAFVDGEVRLTFGVWDAAADAVALLLADAGVVHGDVVTLMMGSSTDFAVCYQAAMRLGAITSAINPRLGPREVASIFERTTPRVTIVDPKVASPAPDLAIGALLDRTGVQRAIEGGGRPATFPAVAADDAVAIVWTSGTTGVPEGRGLRPRVPPRHGTGVGGAQRARRPAAVGDTVRPCRLHDPALGRDRRTSSPPSSCRRRGMPPTTCG